MTRVAFPFPCSGAIAANCMLHVAAYLLMQRCCSAATKMGQSIVFFAITKVQTFQTFDFLVCFVLFLLFPPPSAFCSGLKHPEYMLQIFMQHDSFAETSCMQRCTSLHAAITQQTCSDNVLERVYWSAACSILAAIAPLLTAERNLTCN